MNNMIDKLIYILDAYGINNQIKKYNVETFERMWTSKGIATKKERKC